MTKLSDLFQDTHNANKHTERGIKMVKTSIGELGAGRSILVDKNGKIIAGNLTAEQAVAAGIDDVIVVETDGTKLVAVKRTDLDLSDGTGKARQLAYADNRSAEVSIDLDPVVIKSDLDMGLDLGNWFTDFELEELGIVDELKPGDAEPQMNKADELQEKWGTELGQLWRLPSRVEGNEHRLICGDCTDGGVVERVMGGDEIDLLLTDPPYGINIVKVKGNGTSASDGGGSPVTAGTIRASGKYAFGGKKNMVGTVGAGQWVDATLYAPVYGDDNPFDPSLLLSLPGDKIIFGGNYFSSKLPDSPCWIVWDKNNTGNFADAELAWSSFKTGVKLYHFTWNGLVREGERRLEGVKRIHPTQKPVGLFSNILNDYSNEDDIVADFYHGGGTTLIACENTNRQCRAVEISPAYVGVALERYYQAFGIMPDLVE